MDYEFRPNLLQKHQGVRLSRDSFEIIDNDGRVTRGHGLDRIRSLHEYNGGVVDGVDKKQFLLEQCVIRFSDGPSVTLKSASYSGPNIWADHGPRYRSFMSDLKDRLAQVAPETPVYKGSRAIVVLWYLVGAAAVCLFLVGLAMAGSVIFAGEAIADVIVPAGSCLLFGIVGSRAAYAMAIIHRPSSTTVKQDVQRPQL